MKLRLKKLDSQVVVITGATSGIGLATARLAMQRGARLVLTARNEDALARLQRELTEAGGRVATVTADVADEADVRKVFDTALGAFGGFDTWVNNAAVAVYGRIEDVAMEDCRRLFETDFWGVVHGCRIALPHLKKQGGALINVGSVLSDRAFPLQGMYSAAKHAVKGFTDALRMELEVDRAPVSVTLIKPGSIDTPYTMHAKNYMQQEPNLPPPVSAPALVAEAILRAAEKPMRDVFVGRGAGALAAVALRWPRLTDMWMERTMFRAQQRQEANGRPPGDNLASPGVDLHERGDYSGHVFGTGQTLRGIEALRRMPSELKTRVSELRGRVQTKLATPA
jgi:NAD(P)-dependent dehydrogenase (short-subunit alcohol dehydrogenase family)